MTSLELNKASVIAFYEWMFNDCKPREAIEQCGRPADMLLPLDEWGGRYSLRTWPSLAAPEAYNPMREAYRFEDREPMKLMATAFAVFTALTGPASAISQPIIVCDENVIPFHRSVEQAKVLAQGIAGALRFSEGRETDEVIATLRNEIENGAPSDVSIYETLLATYTLKLAIDEFVRASNVTLDHSVSLCND